MLKKSTALAAEIDCSWQKQFTSIDKMYNGYSYDSEFWKKFSDQSAVFLYQSDATTLISCPTALWEKIRHFQPSELERKLNNKQFFCDYDDVDYYLFNDDNINTDDGIIPLSIESDLPLLKLFLNQNSNEDIEKADFELDSHFFYGIFDNEKLVAVLASYCYPGKEPFESLSILVSPNARGKGYGKRLLAHLIREVKTRQRKVRYRVNIENKPSITLCQSLGFEAYSRQRVFTQESQERRTMGYTVRNALRDEAGLIAKIHVDSWQVAYKGLMPENYINQFTRERREKMWTRVMTEQLANLIVVEMGKEIVGFLSYELPNHSSEDKTAIVTCCYVSPLYFGQGAGSALIDELETRLLSTPVMQISLKALDTNQQGLNFYKKCGFVRSGEEEEEVIEDMVLNDLTLVKYIART